MDGQPSSPARVGVDVIAVTTRDDFLLELGHALGGQASVNPVESAALALEQLGNSKRLKIVIVDSRDLADVRADVDSIKAHAPQLPVLVFAETHAELNVAAALKGSKVFAVLPIPVDPRKTAAVFGGVVADSKAKQATPDPVQQTSAPLVTELNPPAIQESPRAESGDADESKINLRVLGGVALAAVAVIGLWFLTRDKGPVAPAASKQAPAAAREADALKPEAAPLIETSLVGGKVDELLEKARTAMRERRYTEPAGDNALLYYRSAKFADATNGEALDGLTRVGSVLAKRFEEAAGSSNYEQAALMLAQLKSAVPADSRMTDFESRLTRLRAEIARTQDEAKKKRLAEEQAARETAAAEQKKLRDARAAVAETERKAQLAREKDNEDKLKAEQAARSAAPPSQPQQNAAKRNALLQGSLKRKRYVAPEYPQAALAKSLGGVVTVSFTVDVKGEPRDVSVESADPAGVFDRAAIAAVKRWRYEPVMVDGVPTEVPVRMAIRFAAP
jgi:protein TonB